MKQHDVTGSYVVAMDYRRLSWAVGALLQRHAAKDLMKLKVAGGEHLAAILTTSCFGTPPISLGVDGGIDLVFDASRSAAATPETLGVGSAPFADFEVKSLPGRFRQFDAEISKATAAGRPPKQLTFQGTFRSANEVLHGAAWDQIEEARRQLLLRSVPGHSRNIFLVVHPLEYTVVELYDQGLPLLAHRLEPLTGLSDIDSVWILWSVDPVLVVWSAQDRRWVNVCFGGLSSDDVAPDHHGELALLQQIEAEFLEQSGVPGSPFFFGISASTD